MLAFDSAHFIPGGLGFGAAPSSTGAAAGVERLEKHDRLRWRYFFSILIFSDIAIAC